ncbi:MAG: signal peptidase I [Gammaproteobacteria bacterium RIFCSPHIGHO2_02_FULL_42_13]|nr:MAG: signal peptidase I [Gammaproteobacteria bacterium RIFCSPHIGHO2_02_FULL_42_13]OGT69708.1 MAG: signal peptidase I [Gammaproteobacteria bacterium RIFCSPLOWO2_02_FULL_42_9]
MNFYFPLALVVLTFVSGVIWAVDKMFFACARKEIGKKEPGYVDYSRSFFPILLAVLVIRSFIIQPFTVPTGSLEPTVQPGDFLAVNQFAYGLRLPVINKKIVSISNPKRGDIVVFEFPADTRVDFVKRVVGLPGDHLVYKNKTLYINGQEMKQTGVGKGIDYEPPTMTFPVTIMQENLEGVAHNIQINPAKKDSYVYDIMVPKGQYFMMGDNRDGSEDSRFWGFVPERDLIGKAFFIWMSWDKQKHWVRWSRIGTWI